MSLCCVKPNSFVFFLFFIVALQGISLAEGRMVDPSPDLNDAAVNFILPEGMWLEPAAVWPLKPEWVVAPRTDHDARRVVPVSKELRMDTESAAWFSYDLKSLMNLRNGERFILTQPLNDFIFLDDGSVFVASDKALGILSPVKPQKLSFSDVRVLLFQALLDLPAEKCVLVLDEEGSIYAYGYESKAGVWSLFKMNRDFSGWRPVFSSGAWISAVSVSEGVVYIASGRAVSSFPVGGTVANIIFTHPFETITGIDNFPGKGLFYATRTGVGLIGQSKTEFLKCPSPQIRVKDRTLYVFLPGSLGLMRFTE